MCAPVKLMLIVTHLPSSIKLKLFFISHSNISIPKTLLHIALAEIRTHDPFMVVCALLLILIVRASNKKIEIL